MDASVRFLLEDYLGDFPFADPASRSNALACMLLPFVRLMIDGATPLHLFEASTEGTGKGLCAQACAYPSLGRDLASRPQKEDEAEWRKALTSALLAGPSHIYIDNMNNPVSRDGKMRPIDSGTLAAFLTERQWSDRILGGSKDACIRIRAVIMASGNNLEWSKELNRRIVPIRLRTPVQNPSTRTGFRCAPLTLNEWACRHHRQLLEACLCLCQCWIDNGRPSGPQVFGSYESYARVMGGILGVTGVFGFLDNLKVKSSAFDLESSRWACLVDAWADAYPSRSVTSGELFELITGVVANEELQSAFADLLGEGSTLSQRQRFGNAMSKQVDRVWGDRRIVISEIKGRGGVPTYKLLPAEDPGDA